MSSAPAAKKAFALCLHFVLNCMKWNGFVSCTLVTIGEEQNSNKLIGYNCWEALSCNSDRFPQETSGIIQIKLCLLSVAIFHQHRLWSEVSHSEQLLMCMQGDRTDSDWSPLNWSPENEALVFVSWFRVAVKRHYRLPWFSLWSLKTKPKQMSQNWGSYVRELK